MITEEVAGVKFAVVHFDGTRRPDACWGGTWRPSTET